MLWSGVKGEIGFWGLLQVVLLGFAVAQETLVLDARWAQKLAQAVAYSSKQLHTRLCAQTATRCTAALACKTKGRSELECWRHSSELVPSFLKLLRDGEAEVRVAAAGKVAAFCKLLGSETARAPLVQPNLCLFNLMLVPRGTGEGRPGRLPSSSSLQGRNCSRAPQPFSVLGHSLVKRTWPSVPSAVSTVVSLAIFSKRRSAEGRRTSRRGCRLCCCSSRTWRRREPARARGAGGRAAEDVLDLHKSGMQMLNSLRMRARRGCRLCCCAFRTWRRREPACAHGAGRRSTEDSVGPA